MSRPFEHYTNIELADYIEACSILDDGVHDHIREALLRVLWREQAFVPAKRLDTLHTVTRQVLDTPSAEHPPHSQGSST